jgi:acyl-CoA synthetase (AMP-forming)/AMP-acid ligase II/acyl carrier protein
VLELGLFIQQLKQQKIDTIFITTALFNQIANLYPQGLKTLRNVLFGGEKCNKLLVEKILKQGKPQQLIHVYGPTENTTFSTYYITSEVNNYQDLPIGKPINNTQVYILDKNLQPLPIGVMGELHIGGDGLARGYLNRPDLTAEKFIDNPFGKGKIYKTGDLCRYLPDGNIEYIGRIDNQVKIRGFRIELGEIEATLNQYQKIKETVVIAREKENGEKENGDKYLVAYLIVDKSLEISEIREYLKQKLPDYMIPSGFVFLDKLPLTPNGKIDKKALPDYDYQDNRENEYIPPSNEIEIKLAQIWQEVLNIENSGINDNFFSLGGHSLLATQIVSRIRNNLGVELPLRNLFEYPTIKQLGDRLSQFTTMETGEI